MEVFFSVQIGILNGHGDKLKGKHWRTFERLHSKHDGHVNQSLTGMSAKSGLVIDRLGRIKI